MKNLYKSCLLLLTLVGTLVASAQVPKLSSYPSAVPTVFLDFDGHLVTNTLWNTNGPLECGPSGMDNNKIIEVFNRVAEDYRPFNINVTTDSTKFLAAPINRRIRIILTISNGWYGNGAGGVAVRNSFSAADDTPGFVFTGLLGYNNKNVAEAAAHEAGHTFGLFHQAVYDENCVKTSDYNTGTGSGEIGWAPIMGVGYYRNFTLWNSGPSSMGCMTVQNDMDVITAPANGITFRNDDHGSTSAASTLATFTSNQFNLDGVIEKNSDQDLFRFIMPTDGRFELEATPYNVGTGNSGSDLDMQVSLLNSSMNILNVYNPGALLSSLVDTLLNSGTYYIRVEGKGNLYAPAYASLGSYALQGKFSGSVVLPLHKLELRGSFHGDNHKLDWEIIADEQITSIVLESSNDGRSFSALQQTSNSARMYMYRPSDLGNIQYRLSVTFDNGRHYYSNIVSMKNSSTLRPRLVSNLVTGNTILVNSPGNFSYLLYDLNGRAISKGQLTNGINSVNTPALINGMYMIRFSDNNQQWTDKLVRQ